MILTYQLLQHNEKMVLTIYIYWSVGEGSSLFLTSWGREGALVFHKHLSYQLFAVK